jgi:Ca-activated chloride channel family protein
MSGQGALHATLGAVLGPRGSAVSAVILLLVSSAAGQQPVFRAGAQTVSVYATVLDREGRLVPGLDRRDFQVLDDTRPADITIFSNDILPMTVVLLLDMSYSMSGEQARVRDAALQFVDALLPADRVRIGTFGEEVSLSPWLTGDKTILKRVLLEEVWPGGRTPIWSAVRGGFRSIANEPGRRVLLTLSDGVDTGCPRIVAPGPAPAPDLVASFNGKPQNSITRMPFVADDLCASYVDVERTAIADEFMTYAIGMEGPGLTAGLERLADQTGGGHFLLKRNADLATTLARVADELHHQYAIGFTPVALDGKTHQLEVQLSKPGLSARARKSYVAGDR